MSRGRSVLSSSYPSTRCSYTCLALLAAGLFVAFQPGTWAASFKSLCNFRQIIANPRRFFKGGRGGQRRISPAGGMSITANGPTLRQRTQCRCNSGRPWIYHTAWRLGLAPGQESRSQESRSQESRSQESRSQESRSQESRSQESRSQESRSQESRSQESRSQEPRSQEPRSQEPRSQEPRSQEPRSQEPRSQEPRSQEPRRPSRSSSSRTRASAANRPVRSVSARV